jgi:CheY-like chemotaxis protein
MVTREQYLKQLRSDLNHLYDPDRLRSSPLAALFGAARRFDTPTRLRRILTQAIESLRPSDDEPSHSQAWLIYEPLFYRYVQQLDQQEIADQLGISTRHLRRKQHAALEILADRLWEQFGVGPKLEDRVETATVPSEGAAQVPSAAGELAWLRDVSPDITTDIHQTLSTVLDRVQPLAAVYRTDLRITTDDSLPSLAMHPVALTQALLSVLGVAMRLAPGSQVRIRAKAMDTQVSVRVQCGGLDSGPRSPSDDDMASLDMAHRLVSLSGGELALSLDGKDGPFSADLVLPAIGRLPVLVIDDSTDSLRLLQRYVSDTRYHVIGVQDPGQALSLAEKVSPQIIVLDVMMPQVDGWEVLARLRQHPLTHHIPVIVCTILAEEELALSLGAHGFLHKPVTRQAYLEALDRQVARLASESR